MNPVLKDHLRSAARVFLSSFVINAAAAGAISTSADLRALALSCLIAALSAVAKLVIEWIFPDTPGTPPTGPAQA